MQLRAFRPPLFARRFTARSFHCANRPRAAAPGCLRRCCRRRARADRRNALRRFAQLRRPADGSAAPHCLLTRAAADALAAVAGDLKPRGLVLKVFDCYRPARAVANFVRWARDLKDQKMKAEFYPDVDKRTLFRDGYIASRSGHTRGSTMDLTLATADGHELDMGTPFDL